MKHSAKSPLLAELLHIDLPRYIASQKSEGGKVPFIMITAESKTENVLAAREAGVKNYIVKPFNADTLKARLSSVLGKFQR